MLAALVLAAVIPLGGCKPKEEKAGDSIIRRQVADGAALREALGYDIVFADMPALEYNAGYCKYTAKGSLPESGFDKAADFFEVRYKTIFRSLTVYGYDYVNNDVTQKEKQGWRYADFSNAQKFPQASDHFTDATFYAIEGGKYFNFYGYSFKKGNIFYMLELETNASDETSARETALYYLGNIAANMR